MGMDEVVISQPTRTPVGAFGGVFRGVEVTELAAAAIRAVIERSGIDPELIEDVILGQGYANGEAPDLGRVAALDAGLPVEVGGLQLDRRCGSGLQAVCVAVMQVASGVSDVIIAGGAESMSRAEHYTTGMRWGTHGEAVLHDRLARARATAGGQHYPVPGGMLETAENIRAHHRIPREEQDRLALRSHQRAVAAQDDGRFAEEIVPVRAPQPKGGDVLVAVDEHPRRDTSFKKLAALSPIRRSIDPDATVTAGNASGQNDGAAACLVTTLATADRLGLHPVARLRGWAVAGVAPEVMGLGPVPATERLLKRLDLKLSDMDLIELNEAFAAQVLGVLREWGLGEADHERLNVNGSGISLGHPIGATGVRMMTTLLYELARREARYGLETMCIGGGQGLAAVFERVV